jgi:transposase-like protein
VSDDQPIIRNRRRRALDTSTPDEPAPVVEQDIFDPGPMVHYAPLPIGNDGLPTPPAVRQRVRELRTLDHRAARDFILRTLHTYLVAHRPIDEIARSFGVTPRRVYQWRDELYARIGNELRTKTPTDLIGRQIAGHEKTKATAWQNLYRTDNHADKNRYLNTIITAEKAISDLYARVGMIGQSTLTPVIDTTAEDITGTAGTLKMLAAEFLNEGIAAKGKKKTSEPKTIEQDISSPIDESDYLL